MPLLSALEDLVQRSLAALPGVWERVHFLDELRGENGGYQHWGLEQKYGAEAAQTAMTEAHADLIEELGSTRLAELWLSANQAAYREQVDVEEYLKKVRNSGDGVPKDLRGMMPEHYRYVMTNLSRVARFRSSPTQTAA